MFKRETPSPQSIISELRNDLSDKRQKHMAEIARLEAVIEDAQQRLANHRTAAEVCETGLATITLEQGVTMELERAAITAFDMSIKSFASVT